MIKYLLAVTLLITSQISFAADGKDFEETGHFGVLGALTEDMWKGGFAYFAEKWEFNLIGHYGNEGNNTIETHVITKIGYRHNMSNYNYLAVGLDYGSHPGRKSSGISVSDEYQIGPYISFERYFPNTPVMLVLWVNPFQFSHGSEIGSDGVKENINSRHFFQTGGFGISYLF